jgi:hypothetical protein
MDSGTRAPAWELPADASATKVSKPVLFVLKMTDFQWPHKRDSDASLRPSGPRAAFPNPGWRPRRNFVSASGEEL